MSNYPGSTDTNLELPAVDRGLTEIGGTAINSLRDAVFAIESTLGVNPQGNLSTLVARINVSIDANGQIKQSALSSRGLVSLPIDNSHIATNADVAETKLDLDYATSSLNSRILQNVADINSQGLTINNLAADIIKHYTGASHRHDGYMIDLQSNTTLGGTNVENGLHLASNSIRDHMNDYIDAHDASAISVSGDFVKISGIDVQTSIEELDALDPEVQEHQDTMHDNAIALNESGLQGTQGNTFNTVLTGTIFQTDTTTTTQIMQIMRPNVARVTSKGLDLALLVIGSADTLRIQAGGVDRTYIDVDLTGVVGTTELDDVVEAINLSVHSAANHYPISAYNVDGELTIAHNIPGAQFTIQILDTVSNSAASALGFGDVTSTTFQWAGENHVAHVGGVRVFATKPYIRVYHTLSGASATIDFGLGNLGNFGMATDDTGRILCHITEHTDDSTDNGTYYIQSFPDTASVTLNATISAGSFWVEIPADSVNFNAVGRGELHDIFFEHDADGYGIITSDKKIGYVTISGLQIKDIGDSFDDLGTSVYWKIAGGGFISLIIDGEEGVPVPIASRYTGEVKVYAPDNINNAIIEVTSESPTTNKTAQIYPESFSGSDDKLYIGTIHYSDYGTNPVPADNQKIIKFFRDKRKFGTSYENEYKNELQKTNLADALNSLRNNGVIRGFDVVSNTSDTVKVRGGKALVSGKVLEVETKSVTIDVATDQTHLLVLNDKGKYQIFNDSNYGLSFGEIRNADGYGDAYGIATISEFDTVGGSLSGTFLDRRLFVSDIDKRLDSLIDRVIALENAVF